MSTARLIRYGVLRLAVVKRGGGGGGAADRGVGADRYSA